MCNCSEIRKRCYDEIYAGVDQEVHRVQGHARDQEHRSEQKVLATHRPAPNLVYGRGNMRKRAQFQRVVDRERVETIHENTKG